MTKSNRSLSSQQGFTLVEMAIVLMVIGLLIGGVLRGQELLQQAQLNAVIKQVKSYGAAVVSFKDTYALYPGDMSVALSRLPGCNASIMCRNGNGNNVIGTPDEFWMGGQQTLNDENTQFWKHLGLAHLISGIEVGATTPEWGRTHPIAKATMPGGFTVMTSQAAGVASVFQGALILRLHGSITDSNVERVPSTSPKQSGYIDSKMDDGLPQTGDVQSRAMGNGAVVRECEDRYTAREDAFCVMSFLLNK